MSEPTARIRYEQPAVVRRDSIQGLLVVSKSDPRPDSDNSGISDVNVKENIRPVRW